VRQARGLSEALSFSLFRPFRVWLNLPRIGPRAEGDARKVRRQESVTVEFEPCTGDVAQLGEHLPCTQGVTGSSPVISTSTLTTE
jgi:hypothetical protein